jgi:hypothetical protein
MDLDELLTAALGKIVYDRPSMSGGPCIPVQSEDVVRVGADVRLASFRALMAGNVGSLV